ncbi:MAG: threonine aldolase [Actinomycetia bacterium]|nr:threonine aldolase [Actinomycetes bacterium]
MPSPDGRIDLRSDTVTTPTPEMRRAMADADVGDDVYGEDPTVNRLQSLAAGLLGKEAALYVPTGTMGNQIALRVHGRPGSELLCGARAHIYRYEDAGAAWNAGLQIHPLDDAGGCFGADAVLHAVGGMVHGPPITLCALENTYMSEAGRPWSTAEVAAVANVARDNGLAVHVDGARIWNASVALGTSPSDLCAPADSVMFCLSKGLSAPVGSMLCGTRAFVDAARDHRHRLGGGMRQAGVIAAAGIVALETMVERLAEDHANARRLADALAQRWPGSVDPETIQTNIVCAPVAALPADILTRLASARILAGLLDAHTVRFVTHNDVTDHDIATVIKTLDTLAG